MCLSFTSRGLWWTLPILNRQATVLMFGTCLETETVALDDLQIVRDYKCVHKHSDDLSNQGKDQCWTICLRNVRPLIGLVKVHKGSNVWRHQKDGIFGCHLVGTSFIGVECRPRSTMLSLGWYRMYAIIS